MGHQTCQHVAYRMTCEEFENLWARSGGCCEICGQAEPEVPGGRLVIDHDARIGWNAVRGILCPKCNNLMGFVDAGTKQSEKADQYEANAWYRSAADRASCPQSRQSVPKEGPVGIIRRPAPATKPGPDDADRNLVGPA
ncbi:MAG: endonuclease domain-containing protein [Actinomycetes bacterium]